MRASVVSGGILCVLSVAVTAAALPPFWSYDDPSTVQLKTIYINRAGLGGAFVWAVKDDDLNATLIKTMRANGAYTCVVSGGFTAFMAPLAAAIGFDEYHANTLITDAAGSTTVL